MLTMLNTNNYFKRISFFFQNFQGNFRKRSLKVILGNLQGTFLKVILQSSQDLTRTLISTVPFKGALWRRAPGGPSVELLQPFNPNCYVVTSSKDLP